MSKGTELKKGTWFIIGICTLLGFVAGVFISNSSSSSSSLLLFGDERQMESKFNFISPLLSCGEEPFNHIGNDELIQFEEDLKALVASQKASGVVTDAGVYFRQLKGGPWIGLNEDTEFTPGSLLKVPLALSIFKESEMDPTFLQTEILYEGGEAAGEKYFINIAIEPGKTYAVKTLVEAMLTRSDNNAAVILAQVIGGKKLAKSYTELGIRAPLSGADYSTTVRTYASFFRILYNATYLANGYSEEVLEMLTRSTFKEGLVAGIPTNVQVAHKFGERALGGVSNQLHDCGIVYHPERPYLICIMTRGNNFDNLKNTIRDISKLVYTHVNDNL